MPAADDASILRRRGCLMWCIHLSVCALPLPRESLHGIWQGRANIAGQAGRGGVTCNANHCTAAQRAAKFSCSRRGEQRTCRIASCPHLHFTSITPFTMYAIAIKRKKSNVRQRRDAPSEKWAGDSAVASNKLLPSRGGPVWLMRDTHAEICNRAI